MMQGCSRQTELVQSCSAFQHIMYIWVGMIMTMRVIVFLVQVQCECLSWMFLCQQSHLCNPTINKCLYDPRPLTAANPPSKVYKNESSFLSSIVHNIGKRPVYHPAWSWILCFIRGYGAQHNASAEASFAQMWKSRQIPERAIFLWV